MESMNFNNCICSYKNEREGEGWERVGGEVFTFLWNCDNSVFFTFLWKNVGGFGWRVRKACIYAFRHTE